MRIIAGSARGRVIEAPRGEHTRPTTDRIRESVMSSVISCRGSFEGAHVCDAFAGSGALALEALSRGAESAVLCDIDKEALATIRKNVHALGFDGRAHVLACDVLKRGIPRGKASFDVIFLDPPYATLPDAIEHLLANACTSGILASDCLISDEHDARVDKAAVDALAHACELDHIRTKQYGQTIVDYLIRQG